VSRWIAAPLFGPRLVAVRLVAARLVAARLVAARLVAVRLLAAQLVAAWLLAACRGAPPAPPPPEPDGLELISLGVLPRAPLRYALAKGTTTKLAIDLTEQAHAGELGDRSPPLHVELDVAVEDVLSDGRMKLVSTIRSLGAEGTDPTAVHVGEVGAALAGLAITATLSPGGAIDDVRAADHPGRPLPELAQVELAQLVAGFPQLAMQLPSAPVGIGATWRTKRPIGPASGLALEAVTSIALVGRHGSTAAYEISSELHGADQRAVQDGTTIAVSDIAGSAHGRGTVDLARLAIDASQSAELHMDMTTGSDRTPMSMTQTLRVSSP
jgi:hypothetical protein